MRVIIAEDALLFREGLARLLTDAGIDVVDKVADAPALHSAVDSHSPDVVIVDVRMPPTQTTEGLRAALDLRARHPKLGVLVLSSHIETEYAVDLIAEGKGRVGYLLKERVTDVATLTDAVTRIAAGGSVIDPEVVARLVGRRRERNPLDQLTSRERSVLELMAEGRSNVAIGQRLFITPSTVEAHITNIFSKLELEDAPDDNRRVLSVLTLLGR
jgi:DNA-binding NarL/FixJ family response regulator